MKNLEIRKRRDALKMTQQELADEVAKRCGDRFSQQALQKLESKPNARSRFMHYILDILDEREAGPRGKAKRELNQVEDRHLDAVVAYLKLLNRGDSQTEESE